MAQYQPQDGRQYRNPNAGPSSAQQRDAAYSNIFGGAPPGGRSHTMTSAVPPPQGERSHTMTGPMPSMPGRGPPPRQNQQQPYPPPQQYQQPPNGYQQRPPNDGMGYDGRGPPPQQRRPMPPQGFPQPIRPDRVPFPQPHRMDPRGPGGAPYQRSFTQSPYAPNGPPTNQDPYRTQSLAMNPRLMYQPPANSAPANAFRKAPYQNNHAHTTAQGRAIPERADDERTMSMSSYTREGDRSQTMSGRIIPTPNPRRESEESQQSEATLTNGSDISRLPNAPQINGRQPSGSQASARTMSMASTVAGDMSRAQSMTGNRPTNQLTHTPSTMVAQKRPSLVYGARLSNVAQAFRERISIGEKEKDGLTYQNAFTGYEAVELIAYIIRTSDRNLALLLGRSLDAQKYFHEVAYAHRLRDSPNEIYQFKDQLNEDNDVNGVFTLLTECYSPTCNRDNLCYSIACPRRLEQQQRLNLKQTPGLKKQTSRASLHDDENTEQKLWINTVSSEVAESVGEQERKRQEVISELMYTERDFVKDLEYLRDFWIKPLKKPEQSPIPEHRREKFIRTVFSNCQEVHMVNSKMANALTRRQQQNPVVRNIGDIFLEYVQHFGPFIKYGANQLYGKFEFEKEKGSNAAFTRFVDETERLKESRKLELNGYLTKPTTRLARYPLLLENVLKYTDDANPDKTDVPLAIKKIREVLARVNEESGRAENHFNLMNLNSTLKWGAIPHMDLKLTEETRQLIFKSNLKKTPTSETADVTAYLFDHAVLLVRVKMVQKKEEMKVYRKPIPLELLQIKEMDAVLPRAGIAKRPSSSMIPGVSRVANVRAQPTEAGYPITFKGLGKGGYELTLYCTTQSQREKWMEHILSQKEKLSERHKIFTMSRVCEGFSAAMRINCCRPIDGGRKMVIGTDYGVYVADRRSNNATASKPRRALDVRLVAQLEILEQHSILIVLADKVVYTYSLDALDENESQGAPSKKGRRICSANYINAGTCNGQTLLCCVRVHTISSTVKVFEPMDAMTKIKKKSGLAKMLASGQEVLRAQKEFYIPMESNGIHFLRSKLCVGGAKGFEIVSLETLETQSLLDQADTSLDFVTRKEGVKPIYIERNTSEFLLCYADCSFYVDKNGWRARGDWLILWEGLPNAFATWGERYILAFEPEFIEIRQSDTGGLVCIETHKNIRFLHSSSREILFAYEDESGEDVIASLDFWSAIQPAQSHSQQAITAK